MNKKKILLVDDEVELVKAVKIRLEASGYQVITAYDGDEALVKVSEKPDLVLLDILMPKMDGYTVVSKLKESPDTEKIPVIMFTAKSQVEDITKAADLGAIDYIVKPFDYRKLLEKIRKNI